MDNKKKLYWWSLLATVLGLTACGGGGGGSSQPATPAPTATLSVTPTAGTIGQTETLTWSSTDASSCTASGAWSGSLAQSGTQSISPSTSGTNTFTLTCTGTGGQVTQTASATIQATVTAITYSTTAPTQQFGRVLVDKAQIDYWQDLNATDSTKSHLTQARVQQGTDSFRIFYDANGEISRIQDETTGSFILVIVRGSRVDYYSYAKDGTYQSGTAVYRKSTGWYTADITGVPKFGGQLAVQLGISASATLVATNTSGITNEQPLAANQGLFIDQMLQAGAQQSTIASTFRLPQAFIQASLGTVLQNCATIGGVVGLVVGGGSKNLAAGLISGGLAMFGCVEYYDKVEPLLQQGEQDFNNFLSSTTSLDAAGQAFVSAIDPSGNPPTPASIVDTSRAPASTDSQDTSVDITTEQAVVTGPPAADATLTGVGVDTTNLTYDFTGTIDASGTVAATGTSDNGGADTIAVNGTYDGTNLTGTYSGTTIGSGTATGTASDLGACQTVTNSGGNGTFSFVYNMGASSGTSIFAYNAYTIPDAFTVQNGGATSFSTGGLVSGTGSGNIALNDPLVYVLVSAPDVSTAWQFTLSCP